MILPYHLVKVCGNAVFAAQGSDIHSFNPALEYVSTWKYPVQQTDEPNSPSAEAQESPSLESPAQEEPPTKRRKVEPGQEQGPKGRRAKSRNGQPKNNKSAKYDVPGNERPFIQGLYATTDGRHLVAITGSDKTIWVFEHDGAGNLKQLSQRQAYT